MVQGVITSVGPDWLGVSDERLRPLGEAKPISKTLEFTVLPAP